MQNTDTDLLALRDEFPTLQDSVYMISNSLGAMPRGTRQALAEFADLWIAKSITAWEDWIVEGQRAAARIERILGAAAGTVQMATNVSEVQARIASSLDYTGTRNRVVYTAMNFPSVSYVWQAEQRRGAQVVVVPSDDGIQVPTERLLAAIDERTLIVPISHVLFRSAYIQDVEAIIKHAKSVGALVLLDLYHSAGILPLDVTALGVDMACGGSVKWLCGGPGAAYVYVRPDLIERFSPRVTGWFAHQSPFAFTMPDQQYAAGITRFASGTPPVAALYQARAGAEMIGKLNATALRNKSQRQTREVIRMADEAGFRINSPRLDSVRAGAVTIDFPEAGRVCQELNRRRFFCDHRPGAGIRVAPHFYTTDEEVVRFMTEVRTLRHELAG